MGLDVHRQLDELLDRLNALVSELRMAGAQMAEAVITDDLTGLYNRRYLTVRFGEEAARAARRGTPFCVLMIDLDDVKACNDRFGHLVGDTVLTEAGTLLRSHARGMDVVVRLGGDEFVVLAPETDEQGGLELAERLRRTLSATSYADGRVNLTASVGVAVYPHHAVNLDELLNAADQALYRAKRSGKDRTSVAGARVDEAGEAAQEASPAPAAAEPVDEAAVAAEQPGDAPASTAAGETDAAAEKAAIVTEQAPDTAGVDGVDEANGSGTLLAQAQDVDGEIGPSEVPVAVGFAPNRRLPVSFWRGDQVYLIQAILEERSVGDGVRYVVQTPHGIFELVRTGSRWFLSVAAEMVGNGARSRTA